MQWTAIWFLINILFVVSIIVFLFLQRSVKEQSAGADQDKLQRAKRGRNATAAISVLLFLAMCASFLINMRLNG
ncbi:hypothetical protein [Paenibacillus sp. NEAU-GSW1]|uniref:hypothetical protein n=1 Tax=Paenibacillus sp. NEAU-GSW1 TaxID=2682486 RepID=UPI0012E2FEC4|nr:hypothetical protein [Paenibacillus sp. NEAU-GSW1]MUT66721.1 hypothetical protein [Paenibacillus sp. NEAU-GSW1]